MFLLSPAANKKRKSGKQQLDANTTLPKAAKVVAIVLFERKPLSFCLSSVAGSIGSLALAIGAYRCITVAFAESLFFRQSYDQAANLVRAVSIVASFAKAATKGAQSPFQQLQSRICSRSSPSMPKTHVPSRVMGYGRHAPSMTLSAGFPVAFCYGGPGSP